MIFYDTPSQLQSLFWPNVLKKLTRLTTGAKVKGVPGKLGKKSPQVYFFPTKFSACKLILKFITSCSAGRHKFVITLQQQRFMNIKTQLNKNHMYIKSIYIMFTATVINVYKKKNYYSHLILTVHIKESSDSKWFNLDQQTVGRLNSTSLITLVWACWYYWDYLTEIIITNAANIHRLCLKLLL